MPPTLKSQIQNIINQHQVIDLRNFYWIAKELNCRTHEIEIKLKELVAENKIKVVKNSYGRAIAWEVIGKNLWQEKMI